METNEIILRRTGAGEIFWRQLNNPLLVILALATGISFWLGERTQAVVIFAMMAGTIVLGFWNEFFAEKTISDLLKKISLNAVVLRNGVKQEVPVRSLKPDEMVFLVPGSIVPADMVLNVSDNLEVDEAPLTGEGFPVEKRAGDKVFMGTTVSRGSGAGKIFAIGKTTKLGQISKDLAFARPETDFQKGLRQFGMFLVRVIAIMVVAIIIINILLGRPVIDAVIFSLAIAIGLTPELLPVIVTVSLASGARKLAREDVVVRQLTAIEDLGNMDILCTDKTGTLTEGKISLTSYFDVDNRQDDRVLALALMCNSAVTHHRVFGDAIDTSLWSYAHNTNFQPPTGFKKIAEGAFDFSRRAMFTVVEKSGKREFIYKGAPQNVLEFCRIIPTKRVLLTRKIKQLNESGLRVIAVAAKAADQKEKYSFADAKSLNLVGFITFADSPKASAKQAIEQLAQSGVRVKIVTGDNEMVTKKVCQEIGMAYGDILTGPRMEEMADEELSKKVSQTDVFCRTTPEQKLKIISLLKLAGHTVGFIGDGINDAPSLHAADVGISVNTAVDVAKDAASVVLLHKSLNVIADGVLTGRKIFGNTMKYVLMGTSSDFGNMFSAAGASFFLPFLPMAPSQILLVNSLYDVSQLSIPTDNVDPDSLARPGKWDINTVKKYMLLFGPLGSLYDFLTFGLMFFFFKAKAPLFQTGWFIESLVTEIMVVFVIRTKKLPFIQSRPSFLMFLTCTAVVVVGVLLPFSPLGKLFSFVAPPSGFFAGIIGLTLTYLFLVELGKRFLNAKI